MLKYAVMSHDMRPSESQAYQKILERQYMDHKLSMRNPYCHAILWVVMGTGGAMLSQQGCLQ